MTIDANTLLLLDFNGSDGDTSIIDTSPLGHNPITRNFNVQLDDTQFKFTAGTSSLHNGVQEYWIIPDHSAWDRFTIGLEITIDFWVRFDNLATNRSFCGQKEASGKAWFMTWLSATNELVFEGRWPFQNIKAEAIWIPNIDTWYHIAFERLSDGSLHLYVLGTHLTLTTDTQKNWGGTISGDVTIGWSQHTGNSHSGWLEEFRISDVGRYGGTDFTPETVPYGEEFVPPIEVLTVDKWSPKYDIPRILKSPTNPGTFHIPGLHISVPIKIDKWLSINTPPARRKKVNPANVTQIIFVDFSIPTLPPVTIDQWLSQFPRPNRSKIISRPTEYATSYIASINPVNGNYFDSGVINLTITVTSDESSEWADSGEISFTIQAIHVEDFQLEDVEEISFTIKYPDVGVEVFNSGVPGFISANVIINGLNESNFIQGLISVTREDNTAARFEFSLEEDPDALLPRKPVEFINKIVSIAFAAADMDGIVADYIPIFTGIIKHVVFNDDMRTLNLSGYDYSGIHQTKGEYISENITTVLIGSIGTSGSGTINTGHDPIWGVKFNGNSSVEDGVDYFIDTKNGRIIIPISSNILQFPGSFTYSYARLFTNMKAIIQTIVGKKNWTLQEDRVTIANYTNQKNQPVVSLSDESVIDASRKFLELSGAKLEGNLFPNLRVYSEVKNWINPNNIITVDENVIFENTLVFDIDFDDLLNEQTVRSVQKVNADIVIGNSEILGEFSGKQGSINPFVVQNINTIGAIDLETPAVLAEHRINKRNINSISFSSTGTFSRLFLFLAFSAPITGASWSYFIDEDDFVIQLKHKVVVLGTGAGAVTGFISWAFPAIDYQLTVSGTKINYGGGTPEDVRVVTAQRPISGITDTLKGDVYENPYIETDAHSVNIANAVLLERGNPYTANFEIPVFVGKSANTGDRIDIKRNGNIIFSGIIKRLNYNINLEQGQNSIVISARGVGRGI